MSLKLKIQEGVRVLKSEVNSDEFIDSKTVSSGHFGTSGLSFRSKVMKRRELSRPERRRSVQKEVFVRELRCCSKMTFKGEGKNRERMNKIREEKWRSPKIYSRVECRIKNREKIIINDRKSIM